MDTWITQGLCACLDEHPISRSWNDLADLVRIMAGCDASDAFVDGVMQLVVASSLKRDVKRDDLVAEELLGSAASGRLDARVGWGRRSSFLGV